MNKEVLKIVLELKKKRIRQVDLVQMAHISSEARLSRILNGRLEPTKEELDSINAVLAEIKEGGAYGYDRKNS